MSAVSQTGFLVTLYSAANQEKPEKASSQLHAQEVCIGLVNDEGSRLPTISPAGAHPSQALRRVGPARPVTRKIVNGRSNDEDTVARGSFRLLLVTVYLLFLPAQVAVNIGGAWVFPYRIVLAVGAIWLIVNASRTRIQFGMVEGLMLAACLWPFIAVSAVAGPARAFTTESSILLDVGASYYLARYAFRDFNDVRRLLVLIAPGYFFFAVLLLAETATGHYILQPLAEKMFPSSRNYVVDDPLSMMRFGLLRGSGPWPHPILAGMHLASLLPFFVLTRLRGWPKWLGLTSSILAVCTLSSAALLALAAQCAFIVFDYLTRTVEKVSWKMGIIVAGVFLGALQLLSTRGALGFLMQFGALNTSSASYREVIWRYGTASVANHPFFGVAFGEWERLWWMPSTIDNYWLNLSMQLGIPMTVFMLSVSVMIVAMLARRVGSATGSQRAICLACAISLSIYILGAFSVSLWGQAQVWFSILLGIGASLAQVGVASGSRGRSARLA
jgi:hypothetical protein